MKYFFAQIIIIFLSAMFLLFLFQQETFLPFDLEKNIDWYNVSSVLIFIFLVIQGVLSIIFYIVQKFLTCGLKEFPSYSVSLKWGIIISFLLMFALILNIYHVVSLLWGFVAVGLILLLLILIKF